MRLIDADVLKQQINDWLGGMRESENKPVIYVIEQVVESIVEKIDAQPLVTCSRRDFDYQKAALRTARTDKYDSDLLLLNGVCGLNGEAGECIDYWKKCAFQDKKFDRQIMLEELGDVAWYLAISAYAIGYSLDYVFQKNIEKLEKRCPENEGICQI